MAMLARLTARCALVAVAASLVYANSLLNGFALDDVHIILHNARVHSLADLRSIFLTPYWPQLGTELGLYRPVIIFGYALQWAVAGEAPWFFHAVSIALHALASVLVLLLLERLVSATAALAGAVVFAVHPLHTEAVANIVGQAELVVAVTLLTACLLHARRPVGVAVSRAQAVACCALFGLALGAKESAVVLPGLLVAVDLAQKRIEWTRAGVRAWARVLATPFLLMGGILAAYLTLRYRVLSGLLVGVEAAHALPYITEEHRLLNAFRVFPEVLRLLFIPLDLASDYMPGVIMPVESWTPMVVLGLALLCACVFLALLIGRRPDLGLPAAWLLVTIAPVSNIFFPMGVPIAERTLYLPSVAVCALLAYGWHAAELRQWERPAYARLCVGALAGLVLLFSARTWIRNPDWASTEAVQAALARDHPESYRVQSSLAYAHLQQGHLAEAETHYMMAQRMYARDPQLLMAIATFMLDTGRAERAAPLLEDAVALQPLIVRPRRLLAHACLVQGRFEEALRVLDQAAARDLRSTLFEPIRAYALHGLGRHAEAVMAWRAAGLHPSVDEWQAAAYLGRALALAGLDSEALRTAADARRLAPDSTAAAAAASLARAVESGCYAGTAPGSIPSCDPLGDWFIRSGLSRAPTALHHALPPVAVATALP